jgi:molybdate transport system permease protein
MRATRDASVSRARPPVALLIPAVIGLALIVFPLIGLIQRAPWSNLGAQLTSHSVHLALLLSLRCSLTAVALSIVLGVPLAWMLARTRFPGRSLVRALVTLPMVLPPVVGGVGLLYAYGRRGFAGGVLERLTGVTLAFTTNGAILAETFVSLPFLIIAAEAGFRQMDNRYEDAAATLGAGPWRRFSRVTLPLVLPSLAAGSALAWARALGEFGATITFAGNLEGRTQTMPLAVYVALETNPDVAVVMSLILLVLSLAVLIVLRDRWLGV